jgi:hypothetical protein
MKKITPLFLLTLIVGCHFSQKFQDREEDKNKAELITSRLFEYMKNEEFEKATLLFDEEFYKVTSKEELIEIFKSTQDNLGKLDRVTLTTWNTSVSEGAIKSGNYVLNYTSEFKQGDALQKISLRKIDNEPIKIIGYTLQVDGF